MTTLTGHCLCGVIAYSLDGPVAGWNIPTGNLDGDPGTSPEMHIFAGSKAPWFEIHDAHPQHLTYE